MTHHEDEAVGFEMVGAVTTDAQIEREDADIAAYLASMKKKKKKRKKGKKKKKSKKTSTTTTTAATANDGGHNDGGSLNGGTADGNNANTVANTASAESASATASATLDGGEGGEQSQEDCSAKYGNFYFTAADSRHYPYTVLLDRIFLELRRKHPNSGQKTSHKLPAPVTKFHGSKKTAWQNFTLMCELLGRKPDHVKQFFLAEMNTSGNLDGSKQLILKGRWRPKQVQSLLLRYIREYVTCENCRSPQTMLEKDSNTRLFFLTCSICGANRSVNSIRTGFHAAMKDDRRQAKKALTK